ncbi:hypothetical protein H5410_003395, partial [Solanum commersonii]
HLNTIVELELAFEASIVSLRFFDNVGGKTYTLLSKKEERQLKERRNEDLRIAEPIRVRSLERKDQIDGENEQSACRQSVPQSSTMSPNDPKHDDVEG